MSASVWIIRHGSHPFENSLLGGHPVRPFNPEPNKTMPVLINMTYNGRSGSYLAKIDPGLDDTNIRRICEEAVRAGEVEGLGSNIPGDAFSNFVIDRFHGSEGARLVVRPKVPFGNSC